MKPLFHPRLVNGVFEDPGVYVDFLFEKRALLFDLGDLRALAPRKLLRLSDIFVSHAHMDHFFGFDWLLRVCLGRDRLIRLYGPPGFLTQVERRLGAYTWNLVEGYAADLTFEVTEIAPGGRARRARFRCRTAFTREDETALDLSAGVAREEAAFRVRYAILDHRTPCLAFALEEMQHVNVWKSRLQALGLPPGPWLRELKRVAVTAAADSTPFPVRWQAHGRLEERWLPLGELRSLLHVVPGQKIAYVTDVVDHEDNAARIAALAAGADILFIEAPFLDADRERAARRHHLTARQAGALARRAGAKSVVPFHFSPVYGDREQALRQELATAFAATP